MSSSPIESELRGNLASGDPVGPESRSVDEPWPTVRADVIAGLLREPVAPADERRSRLYLRNAAIEGELDLSSSVLRSRLRLESCRLTHGADLSGSEAESVVIDACEQLGPIRADWLQVHRSFAIERSRLEDAVLMTGARIGEHLSLAGSTIAGGEHGVAIGADLASVGAGFDLSEITTEGTVRLGGLRVAGQLVFNGAALTAPGEGSEAGRSVFADGIHVDGDLFFKEGFTCTGTVSLVQAHVGGVLSLEGAVLTATDVGETAGCSLRADGLRVDGNLFCRDGFEATGAIRLKAAAVEGEVDFSRSRVRAMAHGEDGGAALRAAQLHVGRDFSCNGLLCDGRFEGVGADIGSRLDLCDAELAEGELVLSELRAKELCVLWATPPARLDLSDATVDIYRDSPYHRPRGAAVDAAVPPLTLRGFRFRELANVGDASDRLAWIGAAEGPIDHEPELYSPIEREYRRRGRMNDARTIAIGRHRAARVDFSWWQLVWSYFLDWTVGFGYRLWGAGIWLVLAVTGGWIALSLAGEKNFTAAQQSDLRPAFDPLVYAIDATIPSLDAGQQRFWVPECWWIAVELGLAGVGYALVAALLAGGATVLTRDRG